MKETQQLIAENKLSEALTRLTRLYDDQTMSAAEQQQVKRFAQSIGRRRDLFLEASSACHAASH